ncbi:HupE/UreJ family protein [Methylotenera versatilis]|uniref:HupE/UreJ protein n=1 Tax=Methylotenera versatilis (strain 301) TaxID=666681 RepID=D7DI68_METV0|nr:HupE/UreJ family protein [Methylotenera versatilis]ADI29753.1 HupE/UreJ protein [Methylotenera versatilis 301]
MKKQITIAALFSLFSGIASAHPGHGLDGAYAGFMHPFTGWDHLLVMLAIGVWAAKLGGKARWQLPLTFVAIMATGAVLGLSGLNFAYAETAIAASVMAMGVLLMMSLPMNKMMQLSITALFALFHGLAHGIELQSQSSSAALGGMLFATAMLHSLGLLMASQRVKMVHVLNNSLAWLLLLVGGYLLLA